MIVIIVAVVAVAAAAAAAAFPLLFIIDGVSTCISLWRASLSPSNSFSAEGGFSWEGAWVNFKLKYTDGGMNEWLNEWAYQMWKVNDDGRRYTRVAKRRLCLPENEWG